ncbi:MAG TPA: 50S ribosomal protein L23 [Bacilli bacterium]|nr:50S ribosomal protein L23 [Bacilli bacterium]
MARTKKVATPEVVAPVVTNTDVKKFAAIRQPVITEKTMGLIQNQNKVTIKVNPDSNRTEIKAAFEAIYKVKVANVHILNVLPRSTRRGGRYPGKVPGYKKAIVTLKEGEALDLFKE